ncbi:MAG: hypothetical protein ACLT8I_23665 [Blautia faecis]
MTGTTLWQMLTTGEQTTNWVQGIRRRSGSEGCTWDAIQRGTESNAHPSEDADGNTVTDPQGTLYMTANSASGSKY